MMNTLANLLNRLIVTACISPEILELQRRGRAALFPSVRERHPHGYEGFGFAPQSGLRNEVRGMTDKCQKSNT